MKTIFWENSLNLTGKKQFHCQHQSWVHGWAAPRSKPRMPENMDMTLCFRGSWKQSSTKWPCVTAELGSPRSSISPIQGQALDTADFFTVPLHGVDQPAGRPDTKDNKPKSAAVHLPLKWPASHSATSGLTYLSLDLSIFLAAQDWEKLSDHQTWFEKSCYQTR